MSDLPRVSIVVNNFNYERYVGEAIDSALAQDHDDVEVVVVDDGSTDGSPEVIASYAERIVPVLKSNGGQGSAFNAGFAAATGAAVIFLDADDRLAPQAGADGGGRLRVRSRPRIHAVPLAGHRRRGGRRWHDPAPPHRCAAVR